MLSFIYALVKKKKKMSDLNTRKRKRTDNVNTIFTDNKTYKIKKSKEKIYTSDTNETSTDEDNNNNYKTSRDETLHLKLEKKSVKNNTKKPLNYPNHMLIFGSTQAGKTRLISDLLDDIESVYNFDFDIKQRKLVVISPIAELEIADHMSTQRLWDIELYNNLNIEEEFENHLKSNVFLDSPNSINILLLDDVLTQTKANDVIALNKWFSYFRHINVSIIATVHSYDLKYSTIIDQAGMVVSMYCMNTSSVIRDILKRHLYKGTAKVWNELRRLFISKLKSHDYICLNFTKEALSSQIFFITTTLFNPAYGVNMCQILQKM